MRRTSTATALISVVDSDVTVLIKNKKKDPRCSLTVALPRTGDDKCGSREYVSHCAGKAGLKAAVGDEE